MRLANTADSQPGPSSTSSGGLQSQTSPKANATGTTTIVTSQPRPEHFAVSRQRIMRTARYMVVYPFAYVILTLPLAAGRVSSMAGRRPPLVYFCIAGAMMASCGFIDVILYIYTRKALVRSNVGIKNPTSPSADTPLSPFPLSNALRSEAWNQDWNAAEEGTSSHRPSEDTRSISTNQKETMEGGQIIVSRSVTRIEDSYISKPAKAESLRSLVDKREDEIGHKSWPK